jgi:hypothetical protein
MLCNKCSAIHFRRKNALSPAHLKQFECINLKNDNLYYVHHESKSELANGGLDLCRKLWDGFSYNKKEFLDGHPILLRLLVPQDRMAAAVWQMDGIPSGF